MTERTLAIVKPDAVAKNRTGAILDYLEKAGFRLQAIRMVRLSRAEAETFYAVHRGRAFFESLVEFMTSGPCVPMVLERDEAVRGLREAIGATDPADAAPGTVRALFAENKERNAIHASDSRENAAREVGFFFTEAELAALHG
jgi:nucleoside-diphosphate kinase